MTDTRRKPRHTGSKRKKKSLRIHSGIIVLILFFIFVVIYIGGMAGKSLNKTNIPTMVVKYDVIDIPKISDGVIIRDEQVYKSPASGTLQFLVNENDRVKKGAALLQVKDTAGATVVEMDLEELNQRLYEMQKRRESISLYSAEVDRINKQIKNLVDKNIYKYTNLDTADMYSFLEQIETNIVARNQLMLSENKGTASDYFEEKEIYEEELQKFVKRMNASVGGIISFNLDGLEEVFSFADKDKLTQEQIKMKPAGISNYSNRQVTETDSIFKIISSNEWFIAAYIDNEQLENIKQNNTKTIYIETDNGYTGLDTVVHSINKGEKNSYVLFRITKYMLDYLNQRNVRFKLNDSANRGLKIPNSAIVNRTFLKIPTAYISDANTVTKLNGDKEEAITVMPFKVGVMEDEGFTYVSLDISRLGLNDKLIKYGMEPYEIKQTISIKGVYRVNEGIAHFREINEGANISSGGYTILDPNINPWLRSYDRIVIDGSGIVENQIIN